MSAIESEREVDLSSIRIERFAHHQIPPEETVAKEIGWLVALVEHAGGESSSDTRQIRSRPIRALFPYGPVTRAVAKALEAPLYQTRVVAHLPPAVPPRRQV